MMNSRKLKKFFNSILHGLKGTAIFFMLGVIFFALMKIVYMILSRDSDLSMVL
jgi:hypothetical protein